MAASLPLRRAPSSKLDASRAPLPVVISPCELFAPPMANVLNDNPKLRVMQAILLDPDVRVPDIRLDRIGNPLGVDGPLKRLPTALPIPWMALRPMEAAAPAKAP